MSTEPSSLSALNLWLEKPDFFGKIRFLGTVELIKSNLTKHWYMTTGDPDRQSDLKCQQNLGTGVLMETLNCTQRKIQTDFLFIKIRSLFCMQTDRKALRAQAAEAEVMRMGAFPAQQGIEMPDQKQTETELT